MDLVTVQTFFGWCTIINYGMLFFLAFLLVSFEGIFQKIHSKAMKIDAQELPRIYFTFLGNYKIGIFLFALVPYISLRIMS